MADDNSRRGEKEVPQPRPSEPPPHEQHDFSPFAIGLRSLGHKDGNHARKSSANMESATSGRLYKATTHPFAGQSKGQKLHGRHARPHG